MPTTCTSDSTCSGLYDDATPIIHNNTTIYCPGAGFSGFGTCSVN